MAVSYAYCGLYRQRMKTKQDILFGKSLGLRAQIQHLLLDHFIIDLIQITEAYSGGCIPLVRSLANLWCVRESRRPQLLIAILVISVCHNVGLFISGHMHKYNVWNLESETI